MRIALRAHPPLETTYRFARHETVAMYAHKTRSELLFQPGQRLFQQKLAVAGADGDVFELRLEIDDFLDGDEHHARALGDRKEAPRGRGKPVQLAVGKRA